MTINYSSHFIKQFRKLTKEKQQLAIKRERILIKNPFDSRLKTHKLSGELKNYWSYSINYSDRIIFRFINDREVLFYRIGDHDIYKD